MIGANVSVSMDRTTTSYLRRAVMDKGSDLNKRVWTLFEKAGFQTRPNTADPSEHVVRLADDKERPVDLYAQESELGVRIIGSNKARKKLHSFTAHIHDLRMLREAAGATGALFVAGEKEMRESERRFARSNGIQVWDERQLSYYAAVVEAIGSYAKYEILHALGIPTREETLKDTVLAIRLRQPSVAPDGGTEMFIFTLPAVKLLKTCVVLRKAAGNAFAYQRMVSKKRLPQVGQFVKTPEALLPTNIVVSLTDSIVVDRIQKNFRDTEGNEIIPSREDHELVSLTIPLRYGSLEIIDGQHRLFGFVYADETARRNFNLVVLGIRKLSEVRKSGTFVAINDNARRVDPSLVSYLRYTPVERICRQHADLMAIRLAVELNRMSPFKDAIRLFDFGRQRLTLKGIAGYDLKGLIAPKGLLRKYYPGNSSRSYVRVLRSYFSVVSEVFRNEWGDPKTYIIATNRGVTAFLKLMRSILKREKRRLTKPLIRRYMQALSKNWPDSWETGKLRKTYVGSQGWADFHRDLIKAIRRHRAFRNLEE